MTLHKTTFQSVIWGIFALFLISGFILPSFSNYAQAEDATPKSGAINNSAENFLDYVAGKANIKGANTESPRAIDIVGSLVRMFLSFMGLIFFVLIVYGGVVWLSAGGDSARVDKAIKTISQASIGILIIIMAYLITNFIILKLISFAVAE
ncbi:MAG: hypothetical protein WCV73_04355 [Patescibacteria group bacterium]|jgi:hypothetical protein